MGKTMTPSNDTANFARAIKIVHGRSKGLDVSGQKLVEAMGLKERGFPRTDMSIFSANLNKAHKAGLIELLVDGDCLWVAC